MEKIYACMLEQWKILALALKSSATRVTMIVTAFLAPISGILLTVGICILADTMVGIWKAKKLKEKITSRKLSQIISKMLLYETTVILFYLIDFFILNAIIMSFFTVPLMLTKVIALTLASIEIYSIDENIKAVKGTGLWTAFKRLTSRAKDIKKDVDDII
jgi:Zn-dependent protease with chaperone function